MTAKTMYPAIGEQVLVDCQGIKPLCIVRDVKSAWGKYRFLVVPVAGVGEVWVEESRIQRADRPQPAAQPDDRYTEWAAERGLIR